jgi:predicted ATP-dependent endonuclease of OLD family
MEVFMRITVNNLCKIKNASIEINGLTIITGENDTGKSTIGKLLFSIINSSQLATGEIEEQKSDIYSNIEQIYFYLRRNAKFDIDDKLREEFLPPKFMRELDKLLEYVDIQGVDCLLKSKLDILINSANHIDIAKIYTWFDEIKEIVNSNNDSSKMMKTKMKRYLASEFNSEISNKFTKQISKVEIFDGDNILFDLNIENDHITKYEIYDILNFKDATYIETPLILQMYDLIKNSQRTSSFSYDSRRTRKNFIPIHTLDLVDKMEVSRFYKENDYHEDLSLISNIDKIVNGHVEFNRKSNNFTFSKMYDGIKADFKPLNTASGIKAFGIIELLINAGVITKNNLLIIDEPEIHLHPEWQIEYSKLICNIVRCGVNVLITTHSPYMLQALDYFSEDLKKEDVMTVYLAEKNELEGNTYFDNVTNNINEAFYKLSVPFQKIMWGGK